MGRWFSTPPTRPRAERTRRRALYFAELLESRQLLSVGAVHPAIAPSGNVPALFGPAFTPPATSGGTMGSVANQAATAIQVVIEFNPTGAGDSVALGLFVVGGSFTNVSVATTPGLASGNVASPASSTSDASALTGAISTSTSQTPSITPLTLPILAGPPGASRLAIFAIITPQALAINLAPSTIPVTDQAILATAAQEQQPLPPPVLGQGFESAWTQGGLQLRPENELQRVPASVGNNPLFPTTDHIEPYLPTPEEAFPGAPTQPAEPPAQPAAPPRPDPVETIPIQPVSLSDWGKAPKVPVLSPALETKERAESPSWSMATILGTAAIATGGYHLVLGQSNRFNQRWLPERRSSKTTTGRKSETE